MKSNILQKRKQCQCHNQNKMFFLIEFFFVFRFDFFLFVSNRKGRKIEYSDRVLDNSKLSLMQSVTS